MRSNAFTIFSYAINILLIVYFFWFIIPYFQNLILEDDFLCLLKPVLNQKNGSPFSDLFIHYSDHRIFLIKTLSLVSYYLRGQVDVRLMGFGLLLVILGMIYWFYLLYRKSNTPIIYLVPVLLSILHLQYYEALLWVQSGYNYDLVILLVGFSIYSYVFAKRWQLAISVICCIVATLTFGSGLFSWVILLLMIAWKKDWKTFSVFSIITILIFFFYMHGHKRAEYLHTISLDSIQKSLLYIIEGVFLFISSFVYPEYSNSNSLGIISGLAIVLCISLSFFKINGKLFKANFPESDFNKVIICLFFLLVFILIISCVTSFGRTENPENMWVLMTSRYRFYSSIAVALTYSLYVINFNQYRKLIFVTGFSFCLFFNLLTYKVYRPKIDSFYKAFDCSMANWQKNGIGLLHWNQIEADSIMKASLKGGIYQINNSSRFFEVTKKLALLDFPLNTDKRIGFKVSKEKIDRKFNNFHTSETVYSFSDTDFKQLQQRENGAYIVLKSNNTIFYFPTIQNVYSGYNFFKEGKGFNATIRSPYLNKGIYEVYILVIEKKDFNLISTREKIEI